VSNNESRETDVAIAGGGIVGMATAFEVKRRFPDRRVLVLEKEDRLAAHQTGRNSGVLHSGIYYRPGSLRAVNCREGLKAMKAFCAEQQLPYDVCGKVIVAVDESEFPRLENIYERGQANGVECAMIDKERLQHYEPHTAGIRAIHVPETGIVDFAAVCERLGLLFQKAGGQIVLSAELNRVERHPDSMTLFTDARQFECKYLITCGGLQADRLTSLSGGEPIAKIVPFRGEFFKLKPEAEHLCRNLIYPVPDPRFPFLGVHFTRLVHGGVECGPNAVLAFAREGYTKLSVNPFDLAESLTYPGFLKLALKYWQKGLGEMYRSFSKGGFVRALQRLVPDIRSEHLEPAPSGVRAQALGSNGEILDDFVIQEREHIINVENAPSPAATAALNIGKLIVDKLEKQL
jgi:(S)-2-hydroxyglutarate dehydrogenase